jgi:alpha-1,6-mannosyltransferase
MSILASTERYRALATNVGLIVFGAAYLQFCRDGVVEFKHFVRGYSNDVLMQIVLYIGGLVLIFLGSADRWTLRIILGVALAVRLVGVFTPEFLSSDIYRYVWDGRVQGAGINPYRYIPADPRLENLRDDQIYPKINRKDYAHTIYPPGAQLLFFGVTRISDSEACMKSAMVGFEALACWAMLQMLEAFGRKREEILLYAWHPLCVWEIGSSGHVDAAAVALISVAALARLRDQNVRAAAWITTAAMIKMYPLVLLPALVRRFSVRLVALVASIIVCGYAIYSSVGVGVLGYLGGYSREEGLNTGNRYFFLAWAHRNLHVPLGPAGYVVVSALLVGVLIVLAMRKNREPKRALGYALAISTVITVLFSPHYPWYFLWLLPFAITLRYLPAIVLTLEAVYWYSTNLAIPGEKMFHMNQYMYSIFFVAIALDLILRRARPALCVFARENPTLAAAGSKTSIEGVYE